LALVSLPRRPRLPLSAGRGSLKRDCSDQWVVTLTMTLNAVDPELEFRLRRPTYSLLYGSQFLLVINIAT